jgi:hypothetical protein
MGGPAFDPEIEVAQDLATGRRRITKPETDDVDSHVRFRIETKVSRGP